jgi:biofilm PGA synthesis N-glycosyltransferase PgaC
MGIDVYMSILDFLAIICITIAIYHYLGYPLLMVGLAKIWKTPGTHQTDLQSVSIVIAAYNEESVIRPKLENALSLNYPRELIEIIVVADGSTDSTPTVASEYAGSGVRCLFEPARKGKSNALNRAVATAKHDVLLFSDANNILTHDTIHFLLRALSDERIGGVSGAKRILENRERAASVGDGLYWRYESIIKQAESKMGGTVAADGEIFAMWKRLYRTIPDDVINDDAFLTLAIVDQGKKLAYEPLASATEEASISIMDDFRVKVRMIAGGYQFVTRFWRTIIKDKWFAFKFVSHKLLRWGMPIFLILLIIVTVAQIGTWPYLLLFAAQVIFYGLAGMGALAPQWRQSLKILYVPFYFTAMNIAALFGLMRFLSGNQTVTWHKAKR